MNAHDARAVSPLLDLLFEDGAVGRCLVAPDGSVLRVNREWLRSTGRLLDDVLGASIAELFPESRDLALALHARARGGHRVEIPRHAQLVNGRVTWWEGSVEPVPMEGGTGLLLSARDVTAAAEAIQGAGASPAGGRTELPRLEELVAIHREAPFPLALFRYPEGTVSEVNAAWERLFDLSRQAAVGRTALELGLVADAAWQARVVEELATKGVVRESELEFVTRAGERRTVSFSLARVEFAGAQYCLAISQDVTAHRRVEAALRESEERLRDAHARLRRHVENTPLALVEWDGEYRVRSFSRRAEEIFGFAADEVVGKRIDEIPWVPESDWPAVQAITRGMVTADRPTTVSTNRNLRKDGSVIHCEWYNSALHDASGRLVSVLSLVLDATERHRAEEALLKQERQLQALADSIPQLAWIARADGHIEWYNRRWYEYTGTTPAQMEGWGWQAVHDPAALPEVLRRWRESLATARAFEMEFPLRGADGVYRRFLTRCVPVTDEAGEVVQWFGTNTDVTELVDAKEALAESDRRKSEFLAVLSHELRNPLAPILNGIYLLERVPGDSEQARRGREIIRRQAEHLAHLVDDLLDVTRISRGKIELERDHLDLRDVVRKSTDDARAIFERSGLELRVEHALGPVWVEGDRTRLAQVVGNLLHNAQKFTPAGGSVTVSLDVDDGHALLRVRDTGIGMEPGQEAQMFEPFAQGDQGAARTRGGLGLGLSLVRSLVQMHGGAVSARSEGPGRGTEVTVSLPLDGPREPRPGGLA